MAESDIEKDRFLAEHADFRFREQVCYPNGGISRFYDNGIDTVSYTHLTLPTIA